MKLDDYISDEGLVPTSSLKWEGDQLRLASGDKVWVEPKGSGVVAILRERPDLWQIAKLRVCSTHWVGARLPLFGVPFNVALRKMLAIRQPNENPVKWVARRMDASYLESNRAGIVASMVAHVSFDRSATGTEITLEMWQIEVTPVFWTGRDAKIVVERPTQKPGETHGSEAEDTCGGVQSAGGSGGDQRGADAE